MKKGRALHLKTCRRKGRFSLDTGVGICFSRVYQSASYLVVNGTNHVST